MKRSLKQLGLATFAVMIIGAGVSGVALANNAKEGKEPPLMPPQLQRALGDMELTDAQKEKLAVLREKQKALKDEFWAVFTEEQKTAMLEKMMRHHGDDRRNGRDGKDGRHHEHKKGKHGNRSDRGAPGDEAPEDDDKSGMPQ
ncbi:hypothetical protein FJ444_05965 [Aestuariibacter sp. GS-14]|uniref:hypothetical protein n=1 Tax=Aestuariibacter sp. GS-14 TaxID=2590670 RepID=UPI001126AFF0|nr:hypothetical protein [Aestuariibacter sp. GS-14]TPV59712.1 hypothetical protein FJ444_05965 [Aestuariibacter sp. GS-14]